MCANFLTEKVSDIVHMRFNSGLKAVEKLRVIIEFSASHMLEYLSKFANTLTTKCELLNRLTLSYGLKRSKQHVHRVRKQQRTNQSWSTIVWVSRSRYKSIYSRQNWKYSCRTGIRYDIFQEIGMAAKEAMLLLKKEIRAIFFGLHKFND